MRIILASKSPRRKEILRTMGYNPVVKISECDESKIKEKDPQKLVKILSRLKAEAVAMSYKLKPGDIIIGADTVVAVENKILGKPKDEKAAFEMIKELSGRCHQVYTGVTLIYTEDAEKNKRKTFCVKTSVSVGKISEKEILEYIATGEPMDKAGAYGIQGNFCRFVRSIKGDYFNVVGLPAERTYREIKNIMYIKAKENSK